MVFCVLHFCQFFLSETTFYWFSFQIPLRLGLCYVVMSGTRKNAIFMLFLSSTLLLGLWMGTSCAALSFDLNSKTNQPVSCSYWWWKKSQTTTWDVKNPVNNGINYLPTGVGFLPSVSTGSFPYSHIILLVVALLRSGHYYGLSFFFQLLACRMMMPCHRNGVGHYSVHLYVYDLSNFGIDEEIKQYFFFLSASCWLKYCNSNKLWVQVLFQHQTGPTPSCESAVKLRYVQFLWLLQSAAQCSTPCFTGNFSAWSVLKHVGFPIPCVVQRWAFWGVHIP